MIETRFRDLRSVAFPVLVTAVFTVLTSLGVSGTSSARLWAYLNGPRRDPHLLWGMARAIRSDEWFVNTPLVMAQRAAGYPQVNHHLGSGLDLSLVFDVPYRDWSVLFRPQSLAFGILPFDEAFAFKWWLLSVVLLLSVYWFCLQHLPEHRLFASLMALGVFAAPFCQWWFTSTTIGVLAWGFAAMALFGSMLACTSLRGLVLRAGLLAYVGACFSLDLYPAFQVPCLLVVIAYCAGLLANRIGEGNKRGALLRAAAAVGAALVSGAVAGAFALTRAGAVRAIVNTDYPGHRVVSAGGFSIVRLLYGALTPVLTLRGDKAGVGTAGLGGNSSEASAFLLIGLFLVGVQVWLVIRSRSEGLPMNWVLASLMALLAAFLADLFMVSFDLPSKLLGLSLVPHNRLHIGLGMLSTVLIVVTAWEVRRQQVRVRRSLVVLSGVAALAMTVEEASRVHRINVSAAGGLLVIAVASVLSAGIVLALASGRLEVGAGGLLVFCVFAAGGVNPLYRGTFDARSTAVGSAISAVDRGDPGAWISTAGVLANAVMVESGVRSYSGTFSYPTPGQWRRLDPQGLNHRIYNRYAQVVFTTKPNAPLLLNPQDDVVVVRFDACGAFAQAQVQHLLAASPLSSPCLLLRRSVRMPARTFYLYDVQAHA